jgi:hypothetical protein
VKWSRTAKALISLFCALIIFSASDGSAARRSRRARERHRKMRAKTVEVREVSEASDAAPTRKSAGATSQESRVIRFSGINVEGNVRSLQLGYFIDRVRTEFDRPRLPHRTFIPELEQTDKEKHF